jgi:hypothetical protein
MVGSKTHQHSVPRTQRGDGRNKALADKRASERERERERKRERARDQSKPRR